jgi:hypothetical protein
MSRHEMRARAESTGGWGQVGSGEMGRYSIAKTQRTSRMCHWCEMADVKRRADHTGMANGVALCSGCEFHIAMWVRVGYDGMPRESMHEEGLRRMKAQLKRWPLTRAEATARAWASGQKIGTNAVVAVALLAEIDRLRAANGQECVE